MSFAIDFGTQSCRVAVWQNGQPEIVPDEDGNRALPSYVAFAHEGRRFGSVAKAQQGANIENTIYGVKAFLGRDTRDTVIRNRLNRMPYRTSRAGGTAVLQVDYLGKRESFAPEEIVAMHLARLRAIVDMHTRIRNICPVIAIPPGFSRHQRQSILDACDIAGLKMPFLLDDTSAAALYYTFYTLSTGPPMTDASSPGERYILVLNMGAGTTSASLALIDQGIVEIKVATSNLNLGGDQFDEAISKSLAAHLKSRRGIDVTDNPRAQARLLILAERARKELSSSSRASIDLEALSQTASSAPVTITRDWLDAQCSGLYQDVLGLIKSVFQGSTHTKANVQEVILVGGTTRMPGIHSTIQSYFSKETPISSVRNVDEAVALGAAIYGVLKGHPEGQAMPEKLEDMLLMDVVHEPLGVAILKDPVDAGGRLPVLPADGGSPHECNLRVVVARNAAFPCRRVMDFRVTSENDRTASIQVYEGDNKQLNSNALLGSFEMHDIPLVRGGLDHPELVVQFDINHDHSVVVSVHDSNHRKRSLTIRVGRLSNNEKEAMRQRVQTLDEFDQAQEHRLKQRNDFEEYCYGARGSIERLQNGLQECLEWLQGSESTSSSSTDLEEKKEAVINLLRGALPPGYFIAREVGDSALSAD